VVTYSPVPNAQAENCASLHFSGEVQGFRAPNPEMPGAPFALVATNNIEVQ
jgi:hypothetical protein